MKYVRNSKVYFKSKDNIHFIWDIKKCKWIITNEVGKQIFDFIGTEGKEKKEILLWTSKKCLTDEETTIKIINEMDTKKIIFCSNTFRSNYDEIDQLLYPVKAIYLEITNSCTLNCKTCFLGNEKDEYFIEKEKVFTCIDYLVSSSSKKKKEITFTGGEPFLHPDLIEITEYAENKSLPVQIVTNGSVLNKETINTLKRKKCKIQISVDGVKKGTFEKIRGKDTFNRVKHSIEMLLKEDISDRVILSFTPNKINYNEIFEFIDYWSKRGVINFHFSWLDIAGNARKNLSELEMTTAEQVSATLSLVELRRNLVNKGINITGYVKPSLYLARGDKNICPLGETLRIDVKGNVYPCPTFYDVPDEFKLGNIYEEKLEDILKKQKLTDLLQISSNRRNIIPECRECEWKYVCASGCIAVAYHTWRTVYKPAYCELFKKLMEHKIDYLLNYVASGKHKDKVS